MSKRNDSQASAETDNAETETAAPERYKPVGKVVELAKGERDGKTVRVLMDDKRVWKEVK